MTPHDWLTDMALHARWQNETLFGLCASLGDETRRADRGMFFGSIHHTLDHILMVEVRLRDFTLTGKPPGAFAPGTIVHENFEALSAARRDFDDGLLALFDGKPAEWFDERLRFASKALPEPRDYPRQFLLMQLFNHGTHHRSQVTSELHKLGVDYGSTDMPFNPSTRY